MEGRCARFYRARMGGPSLIPGVYFRSLLIGYFEGIEGERGIAWRVADSHREVVGWVLELLAEHGLGKRIGIDSTKLEANAALR